MSEKDWKVVNYSDFAGRGVIEQLLRARASFRVEQVNSQSNAVENIEKIIERLGMTCRVRTNNRGWVVAGASLLTLGGAAVGAAAIGAHNLATHDPDYEIVKDMFGQDLSVNYMK